MSVSPPCPIWVFHFFIFSVWLSLLTYGGLLPWSFGYFQDPPMSECPSPTKGKGMLALDNYMHTFYLVIVIKHAGRIFLSSWLWMLFDNKHLGAYHDHLNCILYQFLWLIHFTTNCDILFTFISLLRFLECFIFSSFINIHFSWTLLLIHK